MSNKLIPVEQLDQTALAGAMSVWTAYRLIRSGALPCVRVGRRVFLTEEGIARFIQGGGAGKAVTMPPRKKAVV
jgi:hypothetical protein